MRLIWVSLLLILVSCGGGSSNTNSTCVATATWQLPTERVNGTPLIVTEISKVTIYMSDAPFTDDIYRELEVQINNPMLITWEIKNIGDGEHFFYLNVTDQDNNTSAFSNILEKIC